MLLSRIARANNAVLSTLQLSKKHAVPIPLQSNLSLSRLAQIGSSDPEIAWPIFQALWDELTTPSDEQNPRPPIMFAVDGVDHFMRMSHYRSAAFELIHAHDLALVEHFVSCLSGAKTLSNGGVILAARSMSNRPTATTFSLMLSQLEARANGANEIPQGDPFKTLDDRVVNVMKDNVELVKVKPLARPDTRTLLEYYAASGLLRETIDEKRVGEKWTLSGGGIVGEVERIALIPRV